MRPAVILVAGFVAVIVGIIAAGFLFEAIGAIGLVAYGLALAGLTIFIASRRR